MYAFVKKKGFFYWEIPVNEIYVELQSAVGL